MTKKAAELYSRGRRSGTSSREAWERMKELNATTDWYTQWLHSRTDVDSDSRAHRQYDE